MKFFDQIRYGHVLAILGLGMAMLIGGAVFQRSDVQQFGLTFVFFGAIVYLMIRRKHLAGKDGRGQGSPGE